MGKLAVMPNIGVRLEEQLNIVGINTPEDLCRTGSHGAWLLLHKLDRSVGITRLYALEGAVRGVKWHTLDEETKAELKKFVADNA